MVRRFFKDSAIYTGSTLVSQAIAFVLFPFLANTLRPRDYGVIDIVMLLMALAWLTAALEISQGFAREVADVEDRDERSAYASTTLIYTVASYTLLVAVALPLARPLTDALLGSHVDVWVTRAAIVAIWVGGALYVVQQELRLALRTRAFAAVAIVNALATTAATAGFVFALGGGAVGYVAGQLVGAGCALVVAIAMSPGLYRLRFDRAKCRRMLAYSLPLVPSSVGVYLNAYADRLAIQHERSLHDVGVYGVGFRISLIVGLLLIGVQAAVTPLVLARYRDATTRADLARALRLFSAGACIGYLVISVFAQPLVRLLAAPSYAAAASVVPLLVLASFLGGMYVFAPGLMIERRTRDWALINIGAGAVNIALAFGLVPVLGIRGAGVAALVSSAFLFVAAMVTSQRHYRVPHAWRPLVAALALSTAIVAVARALLDHNPAAALHGGPLAARLAICLLGGAVVATILVRPDEWRSVRDQLLALFRRRARALGADA